MITKSTNIKSKSKQAEEQESICNFVKLIHYSY